MIADLIASLGSWAWLVLGLILLGAEVLLPGFFFLWFGIAALITGVAALLTGWPWQAQLVAFVVLSLVAVLVGRRIAGSSDGETADPMLNLRANRLQGRTFVLLEPIIEGRGRIKVDDSVWQVRGPDAPAGARVKVTGAEGSVLDVTTA